jgi:hypothetical protein
MAAPSPTSLSYSELYADAARNPFGLDEERKEMCYAAIYEVWRSTLNPMTVETLHQNILADFSRPVGALGISCRTQVRLPVFSSSCMECTASRELPGKPETG